MSSATVPLLQLAGVALAALIGAIALLFVGQDGTEWPALKVTRPHASDVSATSTTIRAPALAPGVADVVFRPRPEQARQTLDVLSILDREIVFRDVPVVAAQR